MDATPDRLAEQETPSLATMTKPPLDATTRDMIGRRVWEALIMRFEDGLSASDRALWQTPPERPEKSPPHLRVMHAFDAFLLGQFAEWGWRLLMSVEVLHRISEWEKHSPALLARLGKELALNAEVLRGEKPAPFQRTATFTPRSRWKNFEVLFRPPSNGSGGFPSRRYL